MEFSWGNKERRLQGLGSQLVQSASLVEITKEIKQGHEVFVICLQPNMEEAWLTAPLDMQELLKGYVELFKEPTQLPP